MCGIAGWAVAGRGLGRGPEKLTEMCDLMAHRGPDDQGAEFFESASGAEVALGMRRLSIVDIEGGHQPICGEEGRVTVVCNGEIYNQRELRVELEAAGHHFRSASDIEVIVHLYEEHGSGALDRLRGMFALAIWDGEELLLARDRIGIKPLYIRHSSDSGGSEIAFASEAKALAPVARLAPDNDAAATYLKWGYLPAPLSPFESIEKLPAGHLATWRDGRYNVRRWWSLDFDREAPSAYEDAARIGLDEAVASHLMADVEIGVFLSGGLDSSVVAALMARNSSNPVKTFTVGFAGDGALDEREAALEVARHIGSEHTEIIVETAPAEALDEVAWAYDEPAGDEAALPTFLMARAAAEHVKVVLTGEGGDEVFGGYRKYQMILAARRLAGAPGALKGAGVRALAAFAGERRAAKVQMMLDADPVAASLAFDEVFTESERERLLTGGCDLITARPVGVSGRGESDALGAMLAADLGGYLADGLLHKVDRMTMAHSLEARVPYLDHRLVETVASIPQAAKVRMGTGKRLLRAIGADLLPADLHRRRKQGFTVPLDSWLRNDLSDRLEEALSPTRLAEQGCWDGEGVRELLKKFKAGDSSLARRVWLLLAWQVWHHAYFESRGEGAKL